MQIVGAVNGRDRQIFSTETAFAKVLYCFAIEERTIFCPIQTTNHPYLGS